MTDPKEMRRLADAVYFVENSGIAPLIVATKGGLQIKYNQINLGAGSAGHRQQPPKEIPAYYRFAYEYLQLIIDQSDGGSKARIVMASKSMQLNAATASRLRRGLEVAKQKLAQYDIEQKGI